MAGFTVIPPLLDYIMGLALVTQLTQLLTHDVEPKMVLGWCSSDYSRANAKRKPLIDVHPTDIYNESMRISILPKTPLGKWSIGLLAAFVLFFVAFLLLVVSGQRGGETFFSNLLLTIPMLLAGTCGLFAFFIGLIAIIRNRERSILVFLAVVVGLFVLLFWLGEVIFPH